MAHPDNAHGFYYEYGMDGAGIELMKQTLQSNVTTAINDMISQGTDGYAKLGVATDSGTSSTPILGVAAHAVTGATGIRKAILYYPALGATVFSGQCSGTPTRTMAGLSVDMEGGTGAMEINENAVNLQILNLLGNKTSYGLNAELYFTFNKSFYISASVGA